VAYSYLTEFRGNQCEGYQFANENFTVTDVHVAVLPDNAWIAKVEGIYQGHPDSSLQTGSFREALESRFPGESCSNYQFCRQKPVKQDYGFELNEPEMTRIQVAPSSGDPSQFIVTLEYVNAVPISIEFQKHVVEQERSNAPVNDF